MKRQQPGAPTADGVWRLPDGKAYYEALLANYTTTDMTATQIHDLGLSEVARIHGEMKTIMAKVGFKGTLQQFFVHLRTSPQRSEEHTSELQSLMRISYAVFCLKKKNNYKKNPINQIPYTDIITS